MNVTYALSHLSAWALLVLTVLPGSSCTHKELCYEYTAGAEIQVTFHWDNAPDASPGSMRLYLFPVDGSAPLSYEFTSKDGGTIRIPYGTYRAICLNSDTESIQYRNLYNYEQFEAYTPEKQSGLTSNIPRGENTDEPLGQSPDMLWVDRKEIFSVQPSAEKTELSFYPTSSISQYQIEINHVKNLRSVSDNDINGTVSGLSDGLRLGNDSLSEKTITIPFPVSIQADSSLTAHFLCFGCLPEDGKSQALQIYIILKDGRKIYYTFDVTQCIKNATEKRHVLLKIDSLSLPVPVTDNSGFHIDVDNWNHVDVPISM